MDYKIIGCGGDGCILRPDIITSNSKLVSKIGPKLIIEKEINNILNIFAIENEYIKNIIPININKFSYGRINKHVKNTLNNLKIEIPDPEDEENEDKKYFEIRDNDYYYNLNYIKGYTLDKLLNLNEIIIKKSEVYDFLFHLAILHENDICYGDLHEENIMYDIKHHTFSLIDFSKVIFKNGNDFEFDNLCNKEFKYAIKLFDKLNSKN